MIYTQNLLRLIVEERKVDIEEILIYLGDLGIINDERTKRALVKREFMQRQGKEESGRSITMDLSVKYDCSESTVNNCIYKHPEIKV